MPTNGIVKPFDVTAKCIRCLFPGLEAGSLHQFRFDGLENGFDHGIIIAITLATHRRMHSMTELERITLDPTQPVAARILAAKVALPFLLSKPQPDRPKSDAPDDLANTHQTAITRHIGS